MNSTFASFFVLTLIVLGVIALINMAIVKKLTKYLEDKFPEEFEKRRIAKFGAFSIENTGKIVSLPYLIVFSNKLHLDTVSAKYANISRILYILVLIIGISLVVYIFLNATAGNLR